MNRTYRIVLNRGTGQWQVASEHARGRGRSRSRTVALAAVLAVACGAPAEQALAGVVVSGDVTPAVNWGDSHDLVVGDTAAGSLLIERSGATVRSASGWLGLTTGGVGTATVAGQGASWVMNGGLVIGASGSGTLTLANSGAVSVGTNGLGLVELGRNPGAVGVINIGTAPGSVATDTAGVVDASEVRFGAGAGTLNINSLGSVIFTSALSSRGGGQHQFNHYAGATQLLGDSSLFDGNTRVSGGSLRILNILGTAEGRIDAGTAPGATAQVSVFNPGSTWALTGNLFVGGGGPGGLSIFNSGTVSNQFATVDAQRNDTASVAISDGGSRWVNRAALLVGSEGGRGAVSILAGGYVSSVDGVIGRHQNGNGTILVTGRGSTWANARELRVGDVEGQGTLMVEGAGSVSNGDSFVGSMSGSGNVIVRGAGSTWNNSGAMTLGFGVGTGAGSLTIAQGGVVNVGASNAGSVSLAKDSLLFYRTSGTINIGAPVGQAAVGAGMLNAGDILFGAGNATVNFNHSDTAYAFATRLASVGNGSHSLNQIAGTTRLTGDNGAFLGKATVSGGRLVVLNQLGGAAEVTGGTLQYGDATTGAANRLAGDLQVSGTGSTLAVQGTASLGVAGNVGMADHTILDLTAGTRGAALRANTVTLGADVSFRLGGIYSTSPAEVLLIDTANGINGDFARISTGGAAGAVDYLSVNTRKSADNRQYLASYGLTWTAGNSLAHGTFTLANASDRFTVGAALADQAANAAIGWNGRTLTKAGAGRLVLGGANTYSGGTRVTGGTLEVERDANLGAAAGGLALEGGGMLATTASFDTARAITVTQSGGFDVAANTTLGLTGLLSGSGDLIKAGEGVLDLKGDSSGFTGRTLVNGGRVAINGRLGGSFTVADGGVLGGNGTLGAGAGSTITVAAGGALSPGNSIGMLTIDGDLVVQPGGRYLVEVDPAGSSADRVHVTGNATLNGGSVMHIGANGNYGLRASYTIMEVDGALSGRFDTVSSDFAFLTPSLAYDYGAGRVSLNLSRNETRMASKGATRNQRATAAAIDSIGLAGGHGLYDAVVRLPDDAGALQAGFDQLSGEMHASAKTVLLQDSRYLRDAMSDRLRAAAGAAGARSAPLLAALGGAAPLAPASLGGPASWIQGMGNWSRIDGDGNAAGVKSSTGGFLMGVDAPVADAWRLGLMAGYSRSDFDANDRASSGHSDNYHLGAYGGGQWGALGLRGGLAYSWHDIATRRSVAMPGFADRLKAGYDGRTAQAFIDLGYRIETAAVALEPFASLAYVNLRTDGYRESGGAAALHASGQATETTFTTLGLRAASGFELGRAQAMARGSLGWRHALGDVRPVATQAFSAGDAFTVAGVAIARDSAVIEAGLDLQVTPRTVLGLAYQGQLASAARDHGVRANLAIRF
ncbi:autotransporter domain-containing protein [Achromobacter xylosoxidans]|uniref:autotransporter domain-containing protein n=1 Tax=Alcaligenes xylosoxydans xylosoxydans TaxID=85698 RepID=UPI0022B86890|nr:autotransporter domain-containing protein [Achromobacter xylosoxidans]MCZ8390500.1 autotransporter domain-containing protein [Achromobacter xylosoxidans]